MLFGRTTRPLRAAVLLTVFALVLAACAADEPAAEPEPEAAVEQEAAPEPEPEPEPAPEVEPAPAPVVEVDEVVYVYSGRHYGLMEGAFVEFTEQTGIDVRFSFGKEAELHERLLAEGRFTPADVLITVDSGYLWMSADAGLLQPIESDILTTNIPAHLRDPDNQWFGLSVRVRTLFYHPDRVDTAELSTIEDLADPRWRDRLCLRPSSKVYTRSIVAAMIADHGEEKTAEVVAGWVANNPVWIDSDTRLLKAVAAGECDVTIANTYYLGRILNEDPDFPVQLFWSNQEDRGAHVNISGGGVTTHARNAENGILLLEWLAGDGQSLFADGNFEYPANPAKEPVPIVAAWGDFIGDEINAAVFGELQDDALLLLDRAGHE